MKTYGCVAQFIYLAVLSVAYAKIDNEQIAKEKAMVSAEKAVQDGQDETMSTEMLANITMEQNVSSWELLIGDGFISHCKYYTKTGNFCEPCDDTIVLWPQTRAGEVALEPCPKAEGISLPGFVFRVCDENGTWYEKADYSVCITELKKRIKQQEYDEEIYQEDLKVTRISLYIYFGGFSVSNISMIVAIIIFARYKHLRCLRNLIHSQLLLAITMKNFVWMGLMGGTLYTEIFDRPIECKIVFTIYRFFHISQFSWMFIEGLYLFMVVVNALLNNTLRFKHCMILGWGLPLVAIAIIMLVNVFDGIEGTDRISRCWHSDIKVMASNVIELGFIALLLFVNTVFMILVIYTLVRKLKNSALNESRQYRKAVKATFILLPLLGGAYIMFYSPSGGHDLSSTIWTYSNAVVQSMQGFIVALVYCFTNGEVRSSITKSHRRWKDEQTLPASDWWTRKRRSSCAIARRDDTETETTTCQYSSRRNSRRVSEDTVSSSRRGSHIPDSIDINSNKPRKASPLTIHHKLIEKDSGSLTSSSSCGQSEGKRCDSSSQLLPNTSATKLDVVYDIV